MLLPSLVYSRIKHTHTHTHTQRERARDATAAEHASGLKHSCMYTFVHSTTQPPGVPDYWPNLDLWESHDIVVHPVMNLCPVWAPREKHPAARPKPATICEELTIWMICDAESKEVDSILKRDFCLPGLVPQIEHTHSSTIMCRFFFMLPGSFSQHLKSWKEVSSFFYIVILEIHTTSHIVTSSQGGQRSAWHGAAPMMWPELHDTFPDVSGSELPAADVLCQQFIL